MTSSIKSLVAQALNQNDYDQMAAARALDISLPELQFLLDNDSSNDEMKSGEMNDIAVQDGFARNADTKPRKTARKMA